MGTSRKTVLQQPSGYHPFIDGLRGVAVLGVLLFHFNVRGVGGGYAGVDIFFVLSGFLITNLIYQRLQRDAFSFAHFYERRARRILPALFITCGLASVAALLLLMPQDMRSFAKSLKGTAFFFSNVVFDQASGYFAAPLATRPLLHTWSLAVEEQFYWLFPPALFCIDKVLRNRRQPLLIALGALFLASLVCSVWQVRLDPDAAFYLLPARAWELLAGSLLALLPLPLRLPRWSAELLALGGSLGIVYSFLAFDRNTAFPGAWAMLPCGGAALVIVSNLSHRTVVGDLLAQRGLVFVGLISYGLYLYHWPILAFTRYFLDHELNAQQGGLALAATVVVALLSYFAVELPVRGGRLLRTRRAVFSVSAAGLLLFGGFGVAAVNADGFPRRLSGAALQYASGSHDQWAEWDACMPTMAAMSAATLCKLGTGGLKPSFLVWGDSHAAALEPAIDARAKDLHVAGWLAGYSRCPSLLGAAPLRHVRGDHPCLAIDEKLLNLVRDNGIKHVLLVSRWDSYIDGWERGGTETNQDLTLSFTTADGSVVTGLEAFRASFAETIHRLQSLDVDVWVVEQVPPQLVDVPQALAKAVYFGRSTDALRRPYVDIESRRAAASAVFDEYRHSPGVSFIDPATIFCPARTPCRIAADGRALYADGNHLSVFGALWSARMLDGFFNSTVQ